MGVSVADIACLVIVMLLLSLFILTVISIPEVKCKDGGCEDCGLPYQDFPMDITIPNEQWTELTGYTDGEGILCGTCIIQRATEKYVVGRLRFEWLKSEKGELKCTV